nr:MAG TPA: Dna polymerase B [Caudoviricetes sp.]
MAIIRSNRQTNYTVIDNRVFADHQLSFAAMGLLGYLLSKPDNWQVSVNQLIGTTEGTEKQSKRDAVLKMLDELKAKGFVQMKRKAEGGVDYIVFDSPQSQNGEIPLRENPTVGNSHSGEIPLRENPAVLINTEDLSNKSGLDKQNIHASAAADAPVSAEPESKPAKPKKRKPSAARIELEAYRVLGEHGIDGQLAQDYIALRKSHRAPITQTALKGIEREANNAGLSLEQALTICCERGWRGFRAEWLHSDRGNHPAQPKPNRINTVPQHTNGGAHLAKDIL